MLVRSPVRLLPLAVVAVLLAATGTAATGVDVNTATDGRIGLSSGSAPVEDCQPRTSCDVHVRIEMSGANR